MTIEQKAREIVANDLGFLDPTGSYWLKDVEDAAEAGIIEGLEMAAKWHDEQAKKRFADQESMKELAPVSSYQAFNDARKHQEHAAAIRALIEEQKL